MGPDSLIFICCPDEMGEYIPIKSLALRYNKDSTFTQLVSGEILEVI